LHLSALTHWETSTYFLKLPPLPKSRALLGARNERDLHEELWGLTRVAVRNWLKNPPAT
jgi:hypothetical protein